MNLKYKISLVTFPIIINNSLCFREAVCEPRKGQFLGSNVESGARVARVGKSCVLQYPVFTRLHKK